VICPYCTSDRTKKDGRLRLTQRFRCLACERTFTDRSATPFARLQWSRDVVVTAVRWYFVFRLSAANVRDLLAERGIDVSARTVLRWAHTFGPLLAAQWRRRAPRVGRCWFVDETYVRVRGRWRYLYRAVDQHGQVVDVLLREQRDLASAQAFFEQAIRRRGVTPVIVISDKHQPYVRTIQHHASTALHIQSGLHRANGGVTTKAIERSHVPIKDRLRPMRGLGTMASGQRLLEGIEAAQGIRRLHTTAPAARHQPYTCARAVVQTFDAIASSLRLAR
jgi:transposase-like protein